MRGLIVNADDFGLSPGINRGIVKAHRDGIVTSTSLLVDTAFSADAAAQCAALPRLTVGLHADLSAALADSDDERAGAICTEELERQLECFHSLMGRWPTHLDSHHDAHRRPDLAGPVVQFGKRFALRVREHSRARYVSDFYGRWNERTRLERIGVAPLARILRGSEDDLIELACHPGYCDEALRSSYRHPREVELRTLCEERLPALLDELGFELLDSLLRRRDPSLSTE